jgi:hypothetical protein
MAQGRKSLDKWIDEAMCDNTKSGPISAFALVHMVAGRDAMVHEEIDSIKLGGTCSYEGKALAERFNSKAEVYCQDRPGVQYCQIWAMYGTNEPQAKQQFLVNVRASEWAGASEPPNDTGERMQNMRHKEMGMQQVYTRQAQMDAHSNAMINLMSSHMQELMRENREANKIVTEVVRAQALDQHTQKMTELQFQRATEERKKWLSFAPALINRLMGQEIFPNGTADTALVEQVAEAMTPELAMKLSEVVPTALWGPLAGRLNDIQVQKRKEREAIAELPRYEGNGEDDVTGGMTRQ